MRSRSIPLLFAAVLLLIGAHASSVHAALGGPLMTQDFNGAHPWPDLAARATPSDSAVQATAAVGPYGTVDVADTTAPSGAAKLVVIGTKAQNRPWSAELTSGLLAVHTSETDLRKLTLSLDHSISSVRPVTVRIESFDADRRRTGGREGIVYPAAPDFYLRSALELSEMHPFGAGAFRPTDPFVRLTFKIDSTSNEAGESKTELRIDNVEYAGAAFYVSASGSDTNDGRTAATAFATPQKALDVAGPGDIIDLMDGTYRAGQAPVASFPRPGLPAAWIVLKNYPGQHPTLTSTGWNIVSITKGSAQQFSHDPPLAYLEVRGLHIRGEGDVARQKYPDALDKVDPRTNSNGVAIDSRYSVGVFHHIRIADNLIEFAPGCGIGGDADWLTVENNVCRSNSWTTIYATSGISVSGYANFDGLDNVYKRLIRNNLCCHNQTYEKWDATHDYSDGNGIILDVNQGQDLHQGREANAPSHYLGRTLVQSNLCYDNGGSGIHSFRADHVDIVNNTAYLNSASAHLEYGEIFAQNADDVRILNNILVAPIANVAAGEKPESVNGNGGSTHVIFSHNVYFGGNIAPVLGDGDVIADPRFVTPSIKDPQADFHLRPDSPALKSGLQGALVPLLDLDGKRRPATTAPDRGAYQK